MDNDVVYSKIKELFIKKGLYQKLVPPNNNYVTVEKEYSQRLNEELPNIYRELKENEALPSDITYELFIKYCQWGFETAQAKFQYGPNVEIVRR